MNTRPDMRGYFKARIESHVHGMMARVNATLPRDVARVHGDVDDAVITVTMKDGSEYLWSGGRYAQVKRNGCYAPLMPKPEVAEPRFATAGSIRNGVEL